MAGGLCACASRVATSANACEDSSSSITTRAISAVDRKGPGAAPFRARRKLVSNALLSSAAGRRRLPSKQTREVASALLAAPAHRPRLQAGASGPFRRGLGNSILKQWGPLTPGERLEPGKNSFWNTGTSGWPVQEHAWKEERESQSFQASTKSVQLELGHRTESIPNPNEGELRNTPLQNCRGEWTRNRRQGCARIS